MVVNNSFQMTYLTTKITKQNHRTDRTKGEEGVSTTAKFMFDEKPDCPYGNLAQNGVIEYNGVVFQCDPLTNSICLGDMSRPKDVLNVNLPSGGHLKLNVHNFEDIARAADMFSPADLEAIMQAITLYNHCAKKLNEIEEEENEAFDTSEQFRKQLEKFIEDHQLTPDNIKKEDDWREMSEEQWDKLLEHFDQYMDDYKEELEKIKKLEEEAARKAAANAPADQKAIAAAKAALKAATNGITDDGLDENADDLEKLSWTYEMVTDDQAILAKAKMANEYASDMLMKSQELSLVGHTTEGICGVASAAECATYEEDETHKKVWKITAFTEQGIICNESVDGVTRELWRIEYKNADDYKKVWEYLSKLEKDADLKFVSDKQFWEEFLER